MRYALVICSFIFLLSAFAKVPRLIVLNSPEYIEGAGFFHNFHIVLALLDCHERQLDHGLIVDFEDRGLYYEPSLGRNWWSYYFEPIHLIPECGSKKRLIKKELDDREKAYFGNNALLYLSRQKAYQLIKKYIHIKKDIQEHVLDFVQKNFKDHYVIGVHYRSTDKNFEAPKVSLVDLYKKICFYKDLYREKRVKFFLATDDKEAKDYLSKRLKEDLMIHNTIYSSGTTGVHYLYRGYQSGRMALIDCLLLSKCQLLIRTASNLSHASACFNPFIPVVNLNVLFLTFSNNVNKEKLNELNRLQ